MIEEIANKIVKAQIKFPALFLLIMAGITLALLPGIFNLIDNVEPSLEKVLPQEIEEVQTMNNMRTQFGADMMYLVIEVNGPAEDIREPEVINYIEQLSDRITTHDYILGAQDPASLITSLNKDVIPNSKNEITNILKLNPLTPQFINHDYSIGIIQVQSDTGASAATIKAVVDNIKQDIEILEQYNPGVNVQITGFNAIDKATFEVIISDFMFITLVSMTLVMIVVWITFKKLLKGMLPMAVVMMALIWTMGIVGYLGFTITVVTMVAAAMIMGLGIDFGIHVVHSYFEERKKHNSNESLRRVMQELLRAMIGASLTTTAGFLALLFGVLPAMKTLGVILAIGIISTLIGAIFLLPVIVYLYDKNSQ